MTMVAVMMALIVTGEMPCHNACGDENSMMILVMTFMININMMIMIVMTLVMMKIARWG